MKALLLDFGATRIKTAIYDTDASGDESKSLLGVKDYPSIAPSATGFGKYEVDAWAFQKVLKDIVDYFRGVYNPEAIFCCSEMHGFILLDKNNRPLSNYISWKDERDQNSGQSVYKQLCEVVSPEVFKSLTGMRLRSGLPVINVCHALKEGRIQSGKICSLPEWLACCNGIGSNVSHITMAAGLGIHDIHSGCVSQPLLDFINRFAECDLQVNDVSDKIVLAGEAQGIPFYTGIGDLQCALLGAGINENSISINMGTGSQVSMLGDPAYDNKLELRPFFENRFLKTITHIPSGRALNCYINFMNDLSGQKINYWERLQGLSLNDILKSNLFFDLALFSGAWNYQKGGCISNIDENNLTAANYMCSLLRSYLEQYITVLSYFVPLPSKFYLLLSGGIPRRIPVIKEYFAYRSSLKTTIASQLIDETLLGLTKLVNSFMKG